ncbi:hypothetical protein JM18_004611 [Phytophthora kernoviae]|uniref:Mitochondrial import inner membrane translocase subunit Tim21 n=2 Tax=Phytophthora kernoviae TaxID=325452 RepID=A0A8T0LZ40_9STRA|nr:hypothetical protein G195_005791 [Phytophthora kernoviae 00238/432]KAG2524231.1 hypothetical protein JM16_005086 [Phytophthora kernoviae]KAG2525993.1 hypothetical protein JM18_004611 [Phytophthora kernoviae]
MSKQGHHFVLATFQILRTVYPFLNNYLHLNGYQTLSARVLLSLPWSFKVIIGIVSDCFPIMGSRRRAYMIVGWFVCSGTLLVLVFMNQEPPFYMDRTLRGKDLSKLPPDDFKGRINWQAPDSGSLYILLMMMASFGYMIADVASDGLVVEFSQREPEQTRGSVLSTVYLVRSVTMIAAVLLVGFGMNGEDYGGTFSWSLSMSQLMLIFALLSLMAVPSALWLIQEPPLGDDVPKFCVYMRGLWVLLQNAAVVQILAYRFFSGIFDGFTITASDPIQRYWAHVHPLNESLFAVLGLVIFSLALYMTKKIGLGWNWRNVIAWTTLSVIGLDAVVGMLTTWDVVRSQWFWLGTPILEELPQAMNFLVSTFVVVELAELGNEAAVYGLLTTVSNLSSPFASCISKNVNAHFDVGVADIIHDSKHVRWQVTWTFVIAYIMKLLSLAWLPLLPRQKRETQELKQRAGKWFWGGVATVAIFTFAFLWSITPSAEMLRFLASPAIRAVQKPVVQQRSRVLQVMTRRPATTRNITTSRSRFAPEKSTAQATKEGHKAPDALVLTPYEKVTATATGGFWLGLIGLGAVGVYFVARELLPNRMSPNGLFSESLDFLSENTDVTSRLGLPIHGYGHDHGGHREGRRNRIEHVNLKDKNGNPRLRIKYNIKGPTGHAYVFAEVNQDMKKNEYVYLIVQVTKTGELLKVIDNRQILSAETQEEQDALRMLLGK